jgi:hypothetical protein
MFVSANVDLLTQTQLLTAPHTHLFSVFHGLWLLQLRAQYSILSHARFVLVLEDEKPTSQRKPFTDHIHMIVVTAPEAAHELNEETSVSG